MKRAFWNRGGGLPFFLLEALGLSQPTDLSGLLPRVRFPRNRDRDQRSMGFVQILKDEAQAKRDRRNARNLRNGGIELY